MGGQGRKHLTETAKAVILTFCELAAPKPETQSLDHKDSQTLHVNPEQARKSKQEGKQEPWRLLTLCVLRVPNYV